ncbi:MAG: glycosyltransferase family 2 protein [Planctomycetes bacterium]|jgi:glycosyltransferase involved in cell wall biosynthesis|nr:glycosyltransferase family 2 protein [Planctomycetota bacterium]HON46008.1 glycosyltransferase family 2 protein [Planctomycetota bacterium]HPY75319.1 glycosyltransferase family 2 protein [Planctomycetota bacterium]HQB00905.1 glycosyltransferase family 2 protein [Planctomycetota bacterium]HRU51488.1 glycosyltransferase family 2 protein [Planctomycetota bacterium]
MPKISIILPCYNAGEYLHRSIPSCLNQTLKDIEIICINDGSTDNTTEILQEYANKDNRIKIITQKNQGTLVSRKRGMEHAIGEYCMFLDQDDSYELQACQELYQWIEEQKVDMVDCRYNIIEQDNTVHNWPLSSLSYQKLNSLEALEKIVDHRSNFHSAVFIWKKILSSYLYKKVASHIPEKYMTSHEDIFIVSLCFYFARTFYAIDNIYYNHYEGIGFFKGHCFSQFQKAMSSIQTFHSYFMEFVEKQKPPLSFKKSLKKIIYAMIDIEGINIWNQLCPPERKEEGFLLMWNILSKEAIVGRWLENYTFIQNQKRLIQIQQKQLQFFTSLFQNLIKALRFPFDFLSGVYSFVVQKIYKFPNFINKES